MTAYFLDTNIILRHILNDHPVLSIRARTIIEAIESGQIEAWTSDLVIAEIVFVLSSKRTYNLAPSEIADVLLPLINLPHLKLPRKRLHARAFTLYASLGIDYIDAHNAALMELRSERHIFSFDTDFDKVEGVVRRDQLRDEAPS